ncbi:MAG: UDP-glucose/GDP-mannose dehydrogenase family protein [Cyanobacteria bacterium REEB65]|nr:UDP-glucose/GDP-mannose dehydrogenase family protein [Cyanobacteria bacterium REEB65]
MDVCIVGTGYVGLVTGTCLAYLGHRVSCVDADEGKVIRLQEGECPIYEPNLPELLALVAKRGNIEFTTDLAAAVRQSDVVFISVGTPSMPTGEPDLSYVETVARCIGASLDSSRRRLIVNKSTVPIGSGNWVAMLVQEGIAATQKVPAGAGLGSTGVLSSPDAPAFYVASNPEFLREGTAIADTFYPDRIVIGTQDAEALAMLRSLLAPIMEQTFVPPQAIAPRPEGFGGVPLVTTDLQSAEMIKYAANAFLATKISFINEISTLCEKVGANVVEVARGIGLDQRIGPRFLNAGIGWGGSCFRKDILALTSVANEYGLSPTMLRATVDVNDLQRQTVISKLQEGLKILKGKIVGLMGLAFKPNTDDLRDAPAIDIAQTLLKMGCRVKVYDPVAMANAQRQLAECDLYYAKDSMDLALGCDALVIATEWAEFRDLDLPRIREVMRGNVVIDGRNILEPQSASDAGFAYFGIGR